MDFAGGERLCLARTTRSNYPEGVGRINLIPWSRRWPSFPPPQISRWIEYENCDDRHRLCRPGHGHLLC